MDENNATKPQQPKEDELSDRDLETVAGGAKWEIGELDSSKSVKSIIGIEKGGDIG